MTDLKTALKILKNNSYSKWANVHNRLYERCSPNIDPRFQVEPESSVFTIGSCFARNMERHLSNLGYEIPMLDFDVPKEEWRNVPQGILNKYTPPAICQELTWAASILKRDGVVQEEDCVKFRYDVGDKVIDNNLAGFIPVTPDRFFERRKEIFNCFRHAFSADCVTITLGLIECWYDSEREIFIQDAPVTNRTLMKSVQDQVSFVRLSHAQSSEFVQRSLDVIGELNPKSKVLITVSPVPLGVTFTDDDVIVANSYSKSVLRSVAGEIAENNPEVGYFPSYEAVTFTRDWGVFESDLRHVTIEAVGELVIDLTKSYFPVKNTELLEKYTTRMSASKSRTDQLQSKLKLVELAIQNGNFAGAIWHLKEAVEMAPAPQRNNLMVRIANVSLRNRDMRTAEEAVGAIFDEGTPTAQVHFIKAQILKGRGDIAEALRHAQIASDMNPAREDIASLIKALSLI